LHAHGVVLPAGAALADRREQVPRQPLAHIVRRARRAEATHVADGARWRGEVLDGQRARLRRPVPLMAARHVGDAVRRLLINLPLGVVRPDVAGVARLGLAGLLLAELVTQVALLALADGAIRRGRADVVATLAGE